MYHLWFNASVYKHKKLLLMQQGFIATQSRTHEKGASCMTGFAELKDQINKTTDLKEKELLLEQFEAMHRAADEESKLHEDLIRGDWSDWNE